MYLPNPFDTGMMTQGQFSKGRKYNLNSKFSFSKTDCLTKVKNNIVLSYLPLAREKQMDTCLSLGD